MVLKELLLWPNFTPVRSDCSSRLVDETLPTKEKVLFLCFSPSLKDFTTSAADLIEPSFISIGVCFLVTTYSFLALLAGVILPMTCDETLIF